MGTMLELVRKRRSVRTFDGRPLKEEDLATIRSFAKMVDNPFGLPLEFRILHGKENGLSSPVVVGTDLYLGVKMKRVPDFEEAYGYSFEKMILYLESIGVGTVWVGGTMNREAFEKAIELAEDEVMPCMTPLGYTADQMSMREKMMRKGVKADKRKDYSELFFCRDFSDPLTLEKAAGLGWNLGDALEMVQWAPSAVNKQPWRLVFEEGKVHFFEKQDKGYVSHATGDLQRIDVGIAMYHFELAMEETGTKISWKKEDPGIVLPEKTFYVATVEAV